MSWIQPKLLVMVGGYALAATLRWMRCGLRVHIFWQYLRYVSLWTVKETSRIHQRGTELASSGVCIITLSWRPLMININSFPLPFEAVFKPRFSTSEALVRSSAIVE